MTLDTEVARRLGQFVRRSEFTRRGAIVTDLDGTAVHEHEGRIIIARDVELALKNLVRVGRRFVLNSLRFPLSVMRTFGRDWYALADAPIPTVSLNGSLLGHVIETPSGTLVFSEIEAVTLEPAEIGEILVGIEGIVAGGITDVLVFFYPRDWTVGEVIWTPASEELESIRQKYPSASRVVASSTEDLERELHLQPICMIFLLIDVAEDRLMAYQHSKRTSFFTHKGVDKSYGTRRMAARLGFDLTASVGAGDTELDNFLKDVGLALHVGAQSLEFKGGLDTLKLADSRELGHVLAELARLHSE